MVDLETFQILSVQRSERWHAQGEQWGGADWSNAMMGEMGEVAEIFALLVAAGGLAANTVKKIRRIETGTAAEYDPPILVLIPKLAAELADVVSYSVLLAACYEIILDHAVAEKFNEVSELRGLPERL